MKKPILLASVLSLAAAGTAHAGGSPGSIGVGAEYELFGVGGASVNYDQGDFHAGGFLGFADGDTPGDDTLIMIGGRFYYHIHSTAMSDFSLGGGVGFVHFNLPMDQDETDFVIDLGAQIRAFITSNVAISATLGLAIATADADGVILSGQSLAGTNAVGLAGGAGLHYYFF